MNKIETVWVIQRDDGDGIVAYVEQDIYVDIYWVDSVTQAHFFIDDFRAKHFIDNNDLQNCKPVKIEIKVVEE